MIENPKTNQIAEESKEEDDEENFGLRHLNSASMFMIARQRQSCKMNRMNTNGDLVETQEGTQSNLVDRIKAEDSKIAQQQKDARAKNETVFNAELKKNADVSITFDELDQCLLHNDQQNDSLLGPTSYS